MARFTLNGKPVESSAAPDTPLLWVIREDLQLTGTKFGCGIGQCGACTVHLDGAAARSCQLPLSAVEGKKILTIEGLSPDGEHPLQRPGSWSRCPSAGTASRDRSWPPRRSWPSTPKPTDADIDTAMAGNICRCGTYQRIRKAIHRAAGGAA